MATEISRLGGDVDEQADGLGIQPRAAARRPLAHLRGPPDGQAGAVLGLAVPGVEVEDVGTTAKTFPGFAEAWDRLAA